MSLATEETVGKGLPAFLRKSSKEAYGWRVMEAPWMDDPVAHVEKMRNFPIRDDDVLIAAYPKCGTHWLWEVTQMLLKQTTEYEKRTKEQVMMESIGGLERCDYETSPRVLNSHHVIAHLPQQIVVKKTKIIHVVRNPKDTVVSFFWHMKNMKKHQIDSELTFSNLLDAVIADELSLPSYFDYLHQISEYEGEHPDHPIQHIYYEDMKKDPVKIIKNLSQFLNVPSSDEFCQAVADACSFEKMKQIEVSGTKQYPEEFREHVNKSKGEMHFYRKGIIGDWKNHFTVSQNELFDEYLATYTKAKQLKFKFIYE